MSKVIEIGKNVLTGVVIGIAIKAVVCVAVETMKAAGGNNEDDDIITTKREIAYEDIPEFIRKKLEK